jgi:hypothetical protein
MIAMASLNRDASGVVQAGRSALRATEADRDRIEAALRARLGSSARPESSVTPSTRGFGWRFAPGATVGMCVVGAALFFALRSRPSVPTAPPSVQPQATAAAVSTTGSGATDSSSAEPAAFAARAAAAAVSPPASAAVRQGDQLQLEVALLLRATSALSAGRASEALKVLNEHQRQFPNGILSEERRAAKAQALCSLGRLSEGRAELAHLAPQSPAASRATQVCDAASSPTSAPNHRN